MQRNALGKWQPTAVEAIPHDWTFPRAELGPKLVSPASLREQLHQRHLHSTSEQRCLHHSFLGACGFCDIP